MAISAVEPFSFVWFLKKSGGLDVTKITPAALTALTLLIAESNPKEKDRMTSFSGYDFWENKVWG